MTTARAPDDLLALDVALLPPASWRQPLAALNAQLAPPPEGFRFDATHLPHVTLAQEFVAPGRVVELVRRLAPVLGRTAPLALRAAAVQRGRSTSSLRLAATPALARLHAGVMDAVRPVAAGPGGESAFLSDGEPPRPADVEWVSRFRERSAGAHFDPHVTLGVGALAEGGALPEVLADRVALCHLGRYCTCRRVLAEWTLTPRGA